MALPQHYLIALLTPNGRLGQFHFALLAVVIAFAHIYAYMQMAYMPEDEPWNIYSISLLLLIWCKFCILSRRLHDTGSNGFIAVPVLIIATILYLCLIDPSFAGPPELQHPKIQIVLKQGMRIPRALFIAVFLYCIRAQGEEGPNGYGPEFGEQADTGGANAVLDKKKDATMPVHSFRKFNDKDESGWGKRKRPAGFGRR
jgi:uncharacterized membrane protein YhaH (DUF805 family)